MRSAEKMKKEEEFRAFFCFQFLLLRECFIQKT